MDSSNYLHPHYHHLHDHHRANGSSSSLSSSSSPSSSPYLDNNPSSSTSSSCFGVVLHPWTQNTSLINSSNYRLTTTTTSSTSNNDQAITLKSSRSPTHENYNPMSQNPGGFQWPELGDIPPSNSFPKFTDMLINGTTSTSTILDDDLQLCPSSYMIKSNNDLSIELSQKLMLKTLLSSSTPRSMELDDADDEFHFPGGGGGGGRGFVFSQIHPSVNISSPTTNYQPNSSTATSCNSLNSNWPTFDLLSSARFSESGNCGLYDHGKEMFRSSSSSRSFDHVSRPYSDHKTAEAKRPSSSVEAKSSPIGSKKTRLSESRSSSCPPMKVRKEKLGDRIAALQQLVAPFGKTDTASVLMEAIGYIKFLQNQIQTLSVPFMKSQRGGNSRTSQRGNDDPARPDLRGRGLCLVPLTCMSYVTNDGSGVWPPPSFR